MQALALSRAAGAVMTEDAPVPALEQILLWKMESSSLWDLISQVGKSSTLLSAIARVESRARSPELLSSLPLRGSTSPLMLQELLAPSCCLPKAIPLFPNHSLGFCLRNATKIVFFFFKAVLPLHELKLERGSPWKQKAMNWDFYFFPNSLGREDAQQEPARLLASGNLGSTRQPIRWLHLKCICEHKQLNTKKPPIGDIVSPKGWSRIGKGDPGWSPHPWRDLKDVWMGWGTQSSFPT